MVGMPKAYLFFGAMVGGMLISCSHAPNRYGKHAHANGPFTFNSDLILPWSVARSDTSTAKSPALYEFKAANEKVLLFFAARHSTKKDSPMFKHLDWLFNNRRIDALILEGFPSSSGTNPKDMIATVMADADKGEFPFGEIAYAITKAVKRKIPFIGGEQDETQTLDELTRAGFSHLHLIALRNGTKKTKVKSFLLT